MKKTLLLLLTLMCSVVTWADNITLNCTNLNLTSTSYSTTFSKEYGGVTFNSDNIAKNSAGIALKSKGAMWNSSAMPGNITSIQFTALKFSSSSGASATIYGGSSAKAKTEALKTITSDGVTTVSFTGKSYKYFYIDNTGTRALYFECTIYYSTGSSVAYKVTFDAGKGECSTTSLTESAIGSGVTLPTCNAPAEHTFLGWSETSGSTKAEAGKAGDKYLPTSNITLYAVYKNNNVLTAVFDLSKNQYEWDATNDGNVYFDGSTYTPAVEDAITLSVYGNVRMWGETNSSLRLYGDNAGNDPNIYTYGKGSITLTAAKGFKIKEITFEGSNLTFTAEEGTYANPTWTGDVNSITLEKGSNTPQIKSITVTYEPQSFSLTTADTDFYTLFLDYAVTIPKGVTVYAGKLNAKETNLTLAEIENVIPANTGVLLKSDEAKEYKFVATLTNTTVEDNSLQGVAEQTDLTNLATAGKQVLTLGSVGDKVGFYQPKNTYVSANKAYLLVNSVDGPAKPVSISMDDDTATGINAVADTTTNGVAYNLAGQRVAANAKGIVIMNGKKFINK